MLRKPQQATAIHYGVLSPMLPHSPPTQGHYTIGHPMQGDVKYKSFDSGCSLDSTLASATHESATDHSIEVYKVSLHEDYLRGINKVNEPTKKSSKKGGFKSKFKRMIEKLRRSASFKKRKTKKEITIVTNLPTETTKEDVVMAEIEQYEEEEEEEMEEEEEEDMVTPIYSRQCYEEVEILSFETPELGTFAYELMKLCDEKFFGRHY